DDFVGIDCSLSTDLLPTPLKRLTPRAPGARWIAHEPARRTLFQHQPVLRRRLKIPEEFTVVLRDNQLHPTVLYKGHRFYLRIIRPLPFPGLPPPRLIEFSPPRAWRLFP